jgi:hypothetical protein
MYSELAQSCVGEAQIIFVGGGSIQPHYSFQGISHKIGLQIYVYF